MADILRLTLDTGAELARPSLNVRKTPGAAEVALESVGQELCTARQRSGKMLMDVWSELKINPDYLLAIEESRFEALPGRVYAIGFVRSYAAYLGLNADELVDRLKAEMAGPDASEPVIGLVPRPERKLTQSGVLPPPERKPTLGVLPPPERNLREDGPLASPESKLPQALIAGLMVAVLLYSGYHVYVSLERMAQPPVIPVPARLLAEAGLTQGRVAAPRLAIVKQLAPILPREPAPAPAIEAAPTPPVSVPLPTIAQPTPKLPAEPASPPPTEVAATEPVSVPAEPAPRIEVPPPPERGRNGIENSKSRITLRVHRPTRVAVQGTGKRVFIDRMLAAGATYRVPNMAGLRLIARDAGAVEVILDGISVGFAGKNGVTASGLSLTPQNVITLRQPG